MFMKLPEGVSSISIGEAGQLGQVAEGIVEVPGELVEEATRHGLTPYDGEIERDIDYAKKTKAELVAILEEKGIEVPANATKIILLDLIDEAVK